MEEAACNVLYVDRAAREERLVRRGDKPLKALGATEETRLVDGQTKLDEAERTLYTNVETLLETFSAVYLCPSGSSCLKNLARLNNVPTSQLVPTVVLIDAPEDDEDKGDAQPPPYTDGAGEVDDWRIYGANLLRFITADIKEKGLASMVIPVVVRRMADDESSRIIQPTQSPRSPSSNTPQPPPPERASIRVPPEQKSSIKYVDLGSVLVLSNPINNQTLPSLATHVYRVYNEYLQCGKTLSLPTNKRHRPWIGTEATTTQSYPHLREVMVSDLSGKITGAIVEHPVDPVRLDLSNEREQAIIAAIASWDFSAHHFTEDELMHATMLMVEHALRIPGLEEFRIPTDKLMNFIGASRSGYNDFVPYHNFRHVVDVLQAVFHLLVRIGTLPTFPQGSSLQMQPQRPFVAVLRPFEALSLVIAAIGHDVGHPGVNNLFLVRLKSPVAQLYNDKSVLESFHSAVYCQILKKHWPAVLDNDEMKQLLISSILSTDMGIHFEYMEKLGKLQELLSGDRKFEPLPATELKYYRHLACSLLIKCADISNVARPFECAATWTSILTDEFSRQAAMEAELNLASALFAPPAKGVIGLGKSQIGFMAAFAIPLFKGVADVMPPTSFCVEEILRNRVCWEAKIQEEEKKTGVAPPKEREDSDGSNEGDRHRTANAESSTAASDSRTASAPEPLTESSDDTDAQFNGAAGSRDELDGAGIPGESDNSLPPLVRGQSPQQLGSRPNSKPVTWEEGSSGSRPVTSSSARRVVAAEGQVVTHRRSETTDGSASVPESGEWAGSAGTSGSGKTEKAAASTARTSVESTSNLHAGPSGSGSSMAAKGGAQNRKSLVGSLSTPDLRGDATGSSRRTGDGRRERHGGKAGRERGERGDSVFASMRELTRRPSLSRFRFWRRKDGGSGSGSGSGGGGMGSMRDSQPPTPVPVPHFGSHTSVPNVGRRERGGGGGGGGGGRTIG